MLIDEGLARNYSEEMLKAELCPKCNSGIIREGNTATQLKILCPICYKNGSSAHFCWGCKRPWANLKNDSFCGNLNCSKVDAVNKILQSCGDISINQITSPVPCRRACPKCYTLIEHNDGCKHM